MIGTELDFLQFHRIVHAHTMTREGYRYELDSRMPDSEGGFGGVLEIGVVERTPLRFEFMPSHWSVEVGEGDMYIIPPGQRVQVSAVSAGKHTHTSVEFLIDCIARPTEQSVPVDGRRVCLPFLIPAAEVSDELTLLIRQLARDRMRMAQKTYFEECGAFMQILSLIASMQRRQAADRSASPAHIRYCRQAKDYITQNIHRKITAEELAAHVGISRNYLTNLFSACEQQPLCEYINRVKLNHLLELMNKYGTSMRDASEAVGFSDINYVSRIFRKYYGVTLSEYRRLLRK